MITSKEKSWPYLALGLGAFLIFVLELVLAMVEMAVYGGASLAGSFSFSFPQVLGHWALTYLIWGLCAFLLHRVAKQKLGFDLFAFKGKITKGGALLIFVMCSLHILHAAYDWGGVLKPLAEYNGFVRLYGENGRIAAVFQLVYYFFEGLVMMVIIAFGQAFGERRFGKKSIPWGGILLALTWGMFHWLSKRSLETALLCVAIAVYFGVCYLLLKKNAVYSWLLFFIV